MSMPSQSVGPGDQRALVAIDLGAESCRVALLRWLPDGPKIHLVHRFPNAAVERADGLHWDLKSIMDGLNAGLMRSSEIATEGIRAIGVDGWGVDYVRLNDAGVPLYEPFCYRDQRTLEAEKQLHERITVDRMRELTGLQLLRINTVYQMFADSVEMRGKRWLQLPEYVLHAFGGRPVAEFTNATHTQMVGLDGKWSGPILAASEIPEAAMPELVAAGTDVGEVRPELQNSAVLRGTRLIAPACHDTASAIAAIPDAGDDWAYISSGTWSLVGTLLDTPINTDQARAENFTNLGGADGKVCFHKNVNGMWLLRQCMETWEAAGASLKLPELIGAAGSCGSPDCFLDVDDPDLLLPGRMPGRINEQLRRRGLKELSEHHDDAHEMASFLFHSLAARYAAVLRNVAEITGKQMKRIYIMGGGSQNELLNRLTAEATGLEVVRAGTECSTIGNFAVQLATLERTEGKRPTTLWAARLLNVPFAN